MMLEEAKEAERISFMENTTIEHSESEALSSVASAQDVEGEADDGQLKKTDPTTATSTISNIVPTPEIEEHSLNNTLQVIGSATYHTPIVDRYHVASSRRKSENLRLELEVAAELAGSPIVDPDRTGRTEVVVEVAAESAATPVKDPDLTRRRTEVGVEVAVELAGTPIADSKLSDRTEYSSS